MHYHHAVARNAPWAGWICSTRNGAWFGFDWFDQAIDDHHLSVDGALIAGTTRINQIPQTSNNILETLGLPLNLVVLAPLKFLLGIQDQVLLLGAFPITVSGLFDKGLEGVEEIFIAPCSAA